MGDEEKYYIPNEYGELERVSKEEYDNYMKKHPELATRENIPTFTSGGKKEQGGSLEHQEIKRQIIYNVIKTLDGKYTSEELEKIFSKVVPRTGEEKNNQDAETVTREERVDQDIKEFNTPQQEDVLEGKDAEIQRVVEMLNSLKLSEDALHEIESNVNAATQDQGENTNTKEDERDNGENEK